MELLSKTALYSYLLIYKYETRIENIKIDERKRTWNRNLEKSQ